MRQHTVPTPYMVGEAHFYTAETAEGLVLFDTGPPTKEALAIIRAAVDLDRLRSLFITHCHVDHYGLAAFVAENSGAEILIPRKDAVKIRRHEERLAHTERLMAECGFDGGFASRLRATFGRHNIFPDFPDRFAVVEESPLPGELAIEWLACPGHSQSDLVYLWGGHAVTGDILLRDIFQAPLLDVDLETFTGRFRNYDAYCASLLELVKLRGYTIHPGHRHDVASLDDTILFYVRKLLERATQVRRFDDVSLVRDVIGRLFGDTLVDPFVVYLKASEIVFMRDFLAAPERLKGSLERIGLFDRVAGLYGAVAS